MYVWEQGLISQGFQLKSLWIFVKKIFCDKTCRFLKAASFRKLRTWALSTDALMVSVVTDWSDGGVVCEIVWLYDWFLSGAGIRLSLTPSPVASIQHRLLQMHGSRISIINSHLNYGISITVSMVKHRRYKFQHLHYQQLNYCISIRVSVIKHRRYKF